MKTNKKWFTMKAAGAVGEIKIHKEIGLFGIGAEDFGTELDNLGEVTELKININSPGGEVFDGFAIYNMLRRHPANKTVTIDGVAASIASVIAMAGDRVIMPANSFLMIHNPMLWTAGDAADLRAAADLLDKIKASALTIYQRRAKDLTSDNLSKMMDDETWLPAEDAVLQGFADIVEEAISTDTTDEGVQFENRFTKIPTACMCFFRPKNTDDGAAGAAAEGTTDAAGTADAQPAGTGDTGNPEPINAPDPEPKTENNSPNLSGEFTMNVKDIVAKSVAGEKKITTEANNICNMAAGKLDAAAVAELRTILNTNVDLVCEDPEQIDAKVEQIIAAMRVKASEHILAKLSAVPPTPENVQVGLEDQEKFCNVARNVLSMKAGVKVDAKEIESIQKNGMGNMGLQSFCREILARNGVRNAMHMPAGQVYDELCAIRPRMGNSQGSGDFTSVFADVANKVLAKAWETSPTTYQAWTGTDSINDFRAKNIVRLSEAGDVLEIKEGEGFPYTSMKDSKETASLITVGVAYGISRKAIVNDDLNALTDTPNKLARSVRRYINRAVYTGLYGTSMVGPTMNEDSAAMLSSTHANFVDNGSGAAPSTATLATLRQKMMKQTLPAPDGGQSAKQYTNIAPSFILYHSDLDVIVNQLILATYDTDTTAQLKPNLPFIKRLQPLWDPVLDELMAAATDPHVGWYLLADPQDIATVTVFNLSGQTMPTMRQKVSDVAEPLGTAWDIYYDVGIGYPDFRGVAGNYGE